jgi:hypothetical protein
MSKNLSSMRSINLQLGILLLGLWTVSWVLLAWRLKGFQPLGVPLITWGHVFLGVLAVVVSFASVYLFKRGKRTP